MYLQNCFNIDLYNFTVNMFRKFCLFYCWIAEQIQLVKVTWVYIHIYIYIFFLFLNISKASKSVPLVFLIDVFQFISLLFFCSFLLLLPFLFFLLYIIKWNSNLHHHLFGLWMPARMEKRTTKKKRKGFCGLKMKFEGLLLMMICA